MKRLVCLLVIAAMALGMCACTAADTSKQQEESSAKESVTAKGNEFPIVSEPITLKAFVAQGVYTKGDFNDLAIWKDYEEKTNVKVIFEAYPMGQETEKFSLKIASNDLPDFFMKITLTPTEITKYSQEKAFAPITPYLEEYAPNLSHQMEEMQNLRSTITMNDGEIYGFPYLVTASPAQTIPMFYNTKWLDALGYDKMPESLEELKDLLLEVRKTDLNGNGQEDEVPLMFDSFGTAKAAFRGSFGIGTRGSSVNIDIGPDGALRYIPTSEGYKQMLQFLHELYEEKLLYQEIFDADIPAVTALGEQNQVFMGVFNLRDYLGETYKEEFGGIFEPFAGPDGQKAYGIRMDAIAGQNTFITTENQYPEATVRWIDYFYSQEGTRLYFMGQENVTYEFDSEGMPTYNDFVCNNPDGLNKEEVLGNYVPWSGGSNPSIAEDTCFGHNMYPELETQITQSLLTFTPSEVWSTFSYNMEDTTRLITLEEDINTYVDTMAAKFVSGNSSFDEWEEYVATLEKMNLKELLEIYQRGLDDYVEKSK